MSTRSKKKKIVLKSLKSHKTIWHPESTLVYKSRKERIVIGRYINGELIPLDEEALALCEQWSMKPDESLIEDASPDEDEEEPEGDEDQSPTPPSMTEKETSEDFTPPSTKKETTEDCTPPSTTEKETIVNVMEMFKDNSFNFFHYLEGWHIDNQALLKSKAKEQKELQDKYDDLKAKYDVIKKKFDTMKSLFA